MTSERVKYDPQTDTLTLQLGDTPIKESDEIEPGVIVDYDASGQIVGVELLDVSIRMGIVTGRVITTRIAAPESGA